MSLSQDVMDNIDLLEPTSLCKAKHIVIRKSIVGGDFDHFGIS